MTKQMAHHPIADLFPMLAEDELKELAADIAERGLLQPIVLDDQDRILDGRNRHAACELAGVKPEFEQYEGDDPEGYALAVNIRRRNLNQGQQAMVIALADDLFNLNSQSKLARDTGVNRARFSQASTIVQFARDWADAVVTGDKPLSEAYKVAQERKADADSTAAKMAELHELAPDLAVLVANGIRNLAEALKEAKLRAVVREIDEARGAGPAAGDW